MYLYSFYQDTKLYRIKIKNECGSDTELVDLVVLGPPGKPLGPLQVKDVLANSCKLVWKPPEDDGGCPITDYDIEMLCPKTKTWKKVCCILYTRNIIQYTPSLFGMLSFVSFHSYANVFFFRLERLLAMHCIQASRSLI